MAAKSKSDKKDEQKATQIELFDCALTNLPTKDDLASMDVPLFSLSKGGDTAIRKYTRGNRSTTVIPSVVGAATVFDKDLLIYAASQIIEAQNQGLPTSRRVKINAYDFLMGTERGDGGGAYERIIDMLRRLKGTNIETNIPTGKDRKIQTESFSLIEDYKILSEKKRSVSVPSSKGGKGVEKKEIINVLSFELVLSEWLMNGLKDFEVLTINHEYFKLDKPVERKLYEIARKHCGYQPRYVENIDSFSEKMGFKVPRFKVRAALRSIIKADPLPDYHVALDCSKDPDDVVIYTRDNYAMSQHIIHSNLTTWFASLQRHDSKPEAK